MPLAEALGNNVIMVCCDQCMTSNWWKEVGRREEERETERERGGGESERERKRVDSELVQS